LSVFVLDQRKRAVMPCCEKRARQLLERGRAVVDPRYPFTIRLKDRVGGDLDPGGRTTGLAVVADEDGNKPAKVLCLFEVAQPGRRQGWLEPSLQHRVDTCISWRRRLHRLAPVSAISVKRVRFDMQLSENPEILVSCISRERSPVTQSGNTFSRNCGPRCHQANQGRDPRWTCRGSWQRLLENEQINPEYCKLLHRADGYCYARQPALPPRPVERGFQRRRL
jgi:RRXRR protein